MFQTWQKLDMRRPAAAAQAEATKALVEGFKPLALPALAAAVRSGARAQVQPRKPAHRDIPAILRNDAQLG